MEKEKFEKLPSEYRADLLKAQDSIFFNTALFEQCQRVAQMFAESTMVPEHFQKNIGNCMIGLNYAARLKADPFMVLQALYIVHGRPGVESKLVEAGINQSGKYAEPLQYEWLDAEDNSVSRVEVLKKREGQWGCQAFTIDELSGKRVDGPKIHWDLIKGMGWWDKAGPDKTPKTNFWRNMTEMMFYYRAASWFANKNCPEVKLGMHTKEELEDSIIDITPQRPIVKGPDPEVENRFTQEIIDKGGLRLDLLDRYLKICADHFKTSIQEIKSNALENPAGFIQAFRLWSEKNIEPDAEPKIEGSNFHCPHCDFEAVSERGLKKHLTQSHQNVPNAEPSQGQDEKKTQPEPDLKAKEEQEKLEAAQKALEAKRMKAEETIFCPDHEGNVKSSLCKDCLLRNRCDPYKEWQHEKQRE